MSDEKNKQWESTRSRRERKRARLALTAPELEQIDDIIRCIERDYVTPRAIGERGDKLILLGIGEY